MPDVVGDRRWPCCAVPEALLHPGRRVTRLRERSAVDMRADASADPDFACCPPSAAGVPRLAAVITSSCVALPTPAVPKPGPSTPPDSTAPRYTAMGVAGCQAVTVPSVRNAPSRRLRVAAPNARLARRGREGERHRPQRVLACTGTCGTSSRRALQERAAHVARQQHRRGVAECGCMPPTNSPHRSR